MSREQLAPLGLDEPLVEQILRYEHLSDDERAAVEEVLDGLVHDAKGDEAAAINNAGVDAQLAYLLGKGQAPGQHGL